jgi:hypothetical protein
MRFGFKVFITMSKISRVCVLIGFRDQIMQQRQPVQQVLTALETQPDSFNSAMQMS